MGRNRKRELERNSCCSSNGRQQTRIFASLMPKNRALVSIFPVIEANVASITCATTGILSSSLFLYFFSDTHVRGVENLVMDANSFLLRISCYYGKSFHVSFSICLLSLVF